MPFQSAGPRAGKPWAGKLMAAMLQAGKLRAATHRAEMPRTTTPRAILFFLLLIFSAGVPSPGQATECLPRPPAGSGQVEDLEGDYLYKVALIRAAPGRLLALIELMKEERDILKDVGEPLPFWMRHTQGDQWDLMILYPMGSFYEYFEPQRTQRRNLAGEIKGLSFQQLQFEADLLTSYREEVFVRGPEPGVLEELFSENDFYHAEMFVALPGRRRDLLEERRMENRYLHALGRPRNLIFAREAGGPWDSFTLGFFRDLEHYAEMSGLGTPAERDRAAVAAGFESAEYIGNYMRRLILFHRDTLAVSIPWP